MPTTVQQSVVEGDFPLKDSQAARMLQDGFDNKSRNDQMSQRSLSQILGYRNSTALSHMCIGRVPIPVERAVEFARILGMDSSEFLYAVLEQRYPGTDFRRLLGGRGKSAKAAPPDEAVLADLEAFAGMPLANLPSPRMELLKEVLADANARRRMVSPHEAVIIEELRKAAPEITKNGLPLATRKQLVEVLAG